MFHVYIIYSEKLDQYYIGYTSNLNQRLREHDNQFSTFTSKTSDWKIKYSEAFDTRHAAMRREKEVKMKKSSKHIEWLIRRSK